VRRVILDTDAFSVLAERRPGTEKLAAVIGAAEPLLTFASVAELLYGAMVARWGSTRLQRLERAIGHCGLLLPTAESLGVWARLRAGAVRAGHPLGHKVHGNDLWIATCAVYYGLPLVTRNGRHFAGLAELEVVGSETGGGGGPSTG
jgi:predicted nucleic acid-binding protein